MLMIVNPHASRGKGIERWSAVRDELYARNVEFREAIPDDPKVARILVREAIGDGERQFVAVGGDGTVNGLANDLVALAPPEILRGMALGAIGTGSSNDFHKPSQSCSRVAGRPARIDFGRATPHDIGRTTYIDEAGRIRVHRWLINASVGTTAMGNWIYNEARGCIGWLKSLSASLGMIGSAVMALIWYRGQEMTLEGDSAEPIHASVRNLGVVKNPHFTGSLRYDSPHEPDSGDFHVHLLANTSLVKTLVTLARLARGRFEGDGTSSWRGRLLRVSSQRPFAVEGDGETVMTRQASFQLETFRLRLAQ